MDYRNIVKTPKLGNLLSSEPNNTDLEEEFKYKLIDIDDINGWKFKEIDTLGEMGFHIDNETDMICEIEVPTIENTEDDKRTIKIYKNKEGYVMELNRKYVFETFNKLIEFVESTPVINL